MCNWGCRWVCVSPSPLPQATVPYPFSATIRSLAALISRHNAWLAPTANAYHASHTPPAPPPCLVLLLLLSLTPRNYVQEITSPRTTTQHSKLSPGLGQDLWSSAWQLALITFSCAPSLSPSSSPSSTKIETEIEIEIACLIWWIIVPSSIVESRLVIINYYWKTI